MRKFKCERCGEEFLTDVPLEQLDKEYKEFKKNIPGHHNNQVSLCDECYKWVMSRLSEMQ